MGKLSSTDEALDAFRRAVELEPTSSQWLNDLGFSLFEMGNLKEAEVVLNRALALAPPDYDLPRINLDQLQRVKARGGAKRRLRGDARQTDT